MDTQTVSQLRDQLRHVNNPEEIRDALRGILGNPEYSVDSQIVLSFNALLTARLLTEQDADGAQPFLFEFLLPLTLRQDAETRDGKIALIQARELLARWLYQYHGETSLRLVAAAVDRLRNALREGHTKAACWTIAEIGFRAPGIVEDLQQLLEGDVEVGDIGLDTIASLGVVSTARSDLLEIIHHRLLERPTSELLWTLRRLADPSSLPILREVWPFLRGTERAQRIFWLLGDISASSADAATSDEIARMIADFFSEDPDHSAQTLGLSSDILSRCDSAIVVIIFLQLFDNAGSGVEQNIGRRHLLFYRLRECVRPRQLDGFAVSPTEKMISLLRDFVFNANTRETGHTPSIEGDIKVKALDLAFRLGLAPALEWCEAAIEAEPDAFVKNEMLELWSCFRLPALPKSIHDLITQERDFKRGNDNADLILRLAATRLARAQAGDDAFDALLNTGYTLEGYTLQEASEALAAVSVQLARERGAETVVPRLREALASATRSSILAVVARTVEALAEHRFLATEDQEWLAALIRDSDKIEPYARSLLCQALGNLSPITPLTQEVLRQAAVAENKWVCARSLEALARLGALPECEDLLENLLGLSKIDGVWGWTRKKTKIDWGPSVVAMLYVKQPDQFVRAIAELLAATDWLEASQVLQIIAADHSADFFAETSPKIVAALRKRIQERQSTVTAELGLFPLLIHVAPQLLVEEWSRGWRDWMPEARIELADALAELDSTPLASQAAIQLAHLAMDTSFGVRRAALRALGRISPELLSQRADEWMRSSLMEDRRRAAEAIGWLPPERTKSEALDEDEHRAVREVARATRLERQKREWARSYLERLSVLKGDNSDLLASWCIAQALAEVGDDEILQLLSKDLRNVEIPPHLRAFKVRVGRALEKQWTTAKKKWPEPMYPVTGLVESGIGWLEWDAKRRKVKYLVSQPIAEGMDRAIRWQGDAAATANDEILSAFGQVALLEFEDGRRASVKVNSFNGNVVGFVGQEAFPLARRPTLTD